MRNDLILQTVIELNLKKEQVGESCDSAFKTVHKCISTAAMASEDEQKKRLIHILQSFWRGKSKDIDGSKREHLQKIADLVFGITSCQSSALWPKISGYTFQELYLYYCYVERMAKGDDSVTQLLQILQSCRKEKRQLLAAQRKQEEEAAKEKEQRRVDGLCGEERWKYDIFEQQQDMEYFQELDNEEKFSMEDRIVVARLLMEYWKMIKKWTGDKVSKKQVKKIAKIQRILETAQQ